MSSRGSTLLGIVVIILFLGTLVLFSYRSPVSANSLSFVSSNKKALPLFPIKKKLQIITGSGKAASLTSLEELFGEREELLVNFWATWCPPCLEELPSLDYLNKQMNSKENKDYPLLVTISVDEDAKEVPKLFKTLEFSPSLLVLHDPEGEVSMSMGTTRFPETYLINKKGTVLKKWVGPQNWLSENVLQRLTLNPSH